MGTPADADGYDTQWLEACAAVAGADRIEVLACDSQTATLLLTRGEGRSILKATAAGGEKARDLEAQWRVLTALGEGADFPGPRALARHALPSGGHAIEVSYIDGEHPSFERDEDFQVFGATIARLHRISRGLRLEGLPVWDLDRVARHFENPELLWLFSSASLQVARQALERFGPRYAAHYQAGNWTGLVHSDCHRHNVLVDGDRGRLIDFGETGYGVLFWDLGVAIADSVVDAPERDPDCRRALVEGYCSVLPEAALMLETDLPVFEAMRSLEVMTWPVSDWIPERRAFDEDNARENIEASIVHLEKLLMR